MTSNNMADATEMPRQQEPGLRRRVINYLARILTPADYQGLRLLSQQAKTCWTIGVVAMVAIVVAAVSEGSTMGLLALGMKTLLANDQSPLDANSIPHRLALFFGWDTDRHNLFMLIAGLALAAQIVRSVVQLAGSAAVARMDAQVEGNIRSKIFEYFMLGPFAEIRRMKHGELTSYMEQVKYVGSTVQQIYLAAGQGLICVAYVCVLLWISPLSCAAAMVALAITMFLLRSVLIRIRDSSRRHMQKGVELAGSVNEYLNNLRQVRTLGRERLAMDRADAALEESIEARRKSLVCKAALVPSIETLAMLFIAILLTIASQTMRSLADLAPVVTFVFIFHRMLPRLNIVLGSRASLGEYWPFICRVAELQNHWNVTNPGFRGRAFPGLRSTIEFRDLTFGYETRTEPAVSQVSFTMQRGKVVALVGRSGSGKSTLADLLLRLYEPKSGTVEIDGVDYRQYDNWSWISRIATVSQQSSLLHGTVRENFQFAMPGVHDEKIHEVCRKAALEELLCELPDGLDTVLGERGHRLSGGQVQRLALAMAMVRDPDVLILDEPTSQLDSNTEREVWTAIRPAFQQQAVLVIAHRLSTIIDADEILLLEAGRIAERGTHEQLLHEEGLYAQLWRRQAGEEARQAGHSPLRGTHFRRTNSNGDKYPANPSGSPTNA